MARRLLARLRETMARAHAPLAELVRLVAAEMVSEVCSIYALRAGDLLELVATEGLLADAVGRTRLRVGEGLVGVCAATGMVLNLPDAQNHPAFVYRPETGEERFASLLAVPVRRAGRTLGVLTVQNRAPRHYTEEEVEVMETVAMMLAELLASAGAAEGAEEGLGATLPRRFAVAPLAPGVAIGAVLLHGTWHAPYRLLADDPAAELERLTQAMQSVQRGLDELLTRRAAAAGAAADILEAYRLIAADAGWMRRAGAAVRDGLTAEAAVHRVVEEMRESMRRVADPYLRERLADLEDLAGRVLAALGGGRSAVAAEGRLLIARRLGPADVLDWHARGIAGLVVEEGSAAGHAAIIARALGLPAAGGARGVLAAAEDGDVAILDADEGHLLLRPEAEMKQTYHRLLAQRREQAVGLREFARRPATSRDGVPVRLMLNVGLRQELDQLEATGAEGIGLFRTEIPMLAAGRILDVAEQAALYRRVLDGAGSRPVQFRTLDLGGDKLLAETAMAEEQNPAMGWRSLRVGLDRPAVLRRQLRALLLASAGRKLSVMFPMVATLSEFRAARALLQAEAARVRPGPERLDIGAMLEVPSLLFQLDAMLAEADFLSVGTNDLMQFLFAADRGAAALAGRYDLISPPVLDLLADLQRRAAAAGTPISVCGEAAARPVEALALIALGIETLSMPATSVLVVKAALAATDLRAFRTLLAALRERAAGAPSLREPLLAWLREHGVPI